VIGLDRSWEKTAFRGTLARGQELAPPGPVVAEFRIAGQALLETWLRRRAHGVKPATDVHFGMSFTAVMSGSGRAGGFRIPPVHGKLGISTSNHEPVDGVSRHHTTNFTSKFLQRRHGSIPYISG